ncbi:MAG: 50S ribosomal protein L29 [Saprospiraceae bacterium]|nr:50S ribosomal protein L29 [Saprospiraceae bacterium]
MASEKTNWHEMSEEQLETEVSVLQTELQKMKFEKAVRGVADSSQFKKSRQNIARALTELRKRELAEYTTEDLEMRSRIRARRARLKKA